MHDSIIMFNQFTKTVNLFGIIAVCVIVAIFVVVEISSCTSNNALLIHAFIFFCFFFSPPLLTMSCVSYAPIYREQLEISVSNQNSVMVNKLELTRLEKWSSD